MAQVYSKRFFLGNLPAGFSDVYTAPDGFVSVVVCISGTGGGSGGNMVGRVGGAEILGASFSSSVSPSTPGDMLWEGRLVLNAGDVLSLGLAAAGGWQVSGYLLTS